MILDGKLVSQKIKEKIKEKIQTLNGKRPHLVVIQVGENQASNIYINGKKTDCEEVGIHFTWVRLKEDIKEEDLRACILKNNADKTVTGIIVQLPIPKEINLEVLDLIDKEKDADGINPLNIAALYKDDNTIIPATPKGIVELLKYYNIEISGKKAVILGRSLIVGKPLALLLLNENATVSVCHSKTINLLEETKSADILIAAIGKANFVKKTMLKESAVVIDVGINRLEGKKICGDVDFLDCENYVKAITKVPGGIGPMTRCALLENVYELFLRNGLGK